MPAAEPAAAGVVREGDCLHFHGALRRGAVAGLWKQSLALLGGTRRLDLTGVTMVDSAGIALLAELAARAGGDASVQGAPAGFAELRTAYRLGPSLAFTH